jgi:ribosomal protein S30
MQVPGSRDSGKVKKNSPAMQAQESYNPRRRNSYFKNFAIRKPSDCFPGACTIGESILMDYIYVNIGHNMKCT